VTEHLNAGNRSVNARLTERDVLAIRERYAAGDETQAELAEEYGLAQGGVISPIVRGLSWAHVGGPLAGKYEMLRGDSARAERGRG